MHNYTTGGAKGIPPFIFNEIRAWLSYAKDRRNLCFWRDRSGNEVDFIIGDSTAVEVKSSGFVHQDHLKGLRLLGDEIPIEKIVVSRDTTQRKIGDISILPWTLFLEQLLSGRF